MDSSGNKFGMTLLFGAKIAPNHFKNPMIIQNYLFLYHFVLELSNGLS